MNIFAEVANIKKNLEFLSQPKQLNIHWKWVKREIDLVSDSLIEEEYRHLKYTPVPRNWDEYEN